MKDIEGLPWNDSPMATVNFKDLDVDQMDMEDLGP